MDFNKKYKITFLGISFKFCKIFKDLFPNSTFKLYSWRKCRKNLLIKKINHHIDILVLCGFHYGSFTYDYKEFLNINVRNPIFFVEKFASKKTIILYIDTDDSIFCNEKLKKITYSRYKYAKKKLADQLMKRFKNCKILKVPVLVKNDKKKNVDIKGSFISKKIFEILIKFKKINYVTKSKFMGDIRKKIKMRNLNKLNNLKAKYLKIPRPIFFDRILRFIYD